MKYARQTQDALDRLDQSLRRLHTMVKRGENTEALRFMEEGDLKERYNELQTLIKLNSTNDLGASGVQGLGNI
tara:strand:+ start:231 stop:449 length:219 start_codon:yes stop_codon:yes gene_type:complete